MNAIVIAVIVMLALSLLRFSIVFSLIIGALVGGFVSGMNLTDIVKAFNNGLGGGAEIALSYAVLGVFAVALSKTGITHKISEIAIKYLNKGDGTKVIALLYIGFIIVGFLAETLIPVHIAFIPLLVPPLIYIMNKLELDRRAVACVITFSITILYMTVPVGFGAIFLDTILISNIKANGVDVTHAQAPIAMIIPGLGMVVGLLIAVFFSYSRKRTYITTEVDRDLASEEVISLTKVQYLLIGLAIIAAIVVQLYSNSIILGGLIGYLIISISGILKWKDQNSIFMQGVSLMAFIGFVMITASGFASTMKATGEITHLVSSINDIFNGNRFLITGMMLLVGLLVTMGIGSSFSTVPIIASIYVPICISLGFSPLATIAVVGTAAALGDAGSPASDSTLGPTAGLNIDGQHNHIYDTVVPTFIHFNIPLLICGWIAALIL